MSSVIRKGYIIVAVIILVGILSSCSGAGDRGSQTKIVKTSVAITSINSAQVPLWVAADKGFFTKYGLDVSLPYIESSSTATQGLLSGEPPLAGMGATAAVNADLSGGDIVMVAGLMNTMPYELVVNSKIKGPQDLKGQKIGISKAGTSSDLGARLILNKLNLQPSKDVALVSAGNQSERLAGLQNGAVQGALMEMPFTLVANKAGFPTLVNMAELKIPFSYNGIATTKKFLKSNPDTIERFLKATIAAIHYMKTNKEGTLEVMGRNMKLDDKESLGAMYDAYVGTLFLEYPIIPDEAIQVILEDIGSTNEKAKSAKAGDFLDMNILKKIKDSGFIDEVYGKK